MIISDRGKGITVHISRSGDAFELTVSRIGEPASVSFSCYGDLDKLLTDLGAVRSDGAKMTGDVAPPPPPAKRRMFPVLAQSAKAEYDRVGMPRSVPWDFLDPHEEWARINHAQDLEKLASRGGLGAHEMIAIVEHRRLRELPKNWMTIEEQYEKLTDLLLAHEEGLAKKTSESA